jgi:hypothetical protein
MSSRAGSSIGTFLMSMPVSAMVLMGIFGVPRFAPGVGGESGWQNARQFFASWANTPEAAPGRPQFPGHASDHELGSPGDGEAPAWGTAPPSAGDSRPSPGLLAMADNGARLASEAWPGTESRHPLMSRAAAAADPENAPVTITWQEARRRLADLGIDQFHLEPALEGDQYLFVCLLSPGGDARVTQRFEAQSGEPLAAVQAVLTQIDGWLAQQYADSRRIPAPFGAR